MTSKETKEEVETLVSLYNSASNEKIKPGLEESIKNTMIYEQVKACIEKSYSYLSPICRKTILKVMVKNIEELKFAGENKRNKFFTETIIEEAGKIMMGEKPVTDDYDSTNYDDLVKKFGSQVIEPLKEYEMNKSRRGRFFIICAKRNGYEKDIKNYKFVAKVLGFADEDIVVFDDKEKDFVLQKFKEYKEEGDPDDDCVIVACSSHGKKKDMLQLKYGELLPISRLVEHLSNFTGPKVFFIQACRGNLAEKKASFTTNDEIFKSSECTTSTNLNDLLLVFSTIPDNVSFRDPNEGSHFVKILKDEFENYVKDHENIDIIELLTKTISTLAAKQFKAVLERTPEGEVERELKQMACFRTSLTKRLVFKKKVQDSRVESCGNDNNKCMSFVSYQPECDDDDDTFVTSEN